MVQVLWIFSLGKCSKYLFRYFQEDNALEVALKFFQGQCSRIIHFLEQLTSNNVIRIDRVDLLEFFANSGKAVFGSGHGKGPDAIKDAYTVARQKMDYWHCDNSYPRKMLINIKFGKNINNIDSITRLEKPLPDCKILFTADGRGKDDEVEIGMVATNFTGNCG